MDKFDTGFIDKINLLESQFEKENNLVKFNYMNYFTTENKNLYKIDFQTSNLIFKLKKHILSMIKYQGVFYILDTYGDIYKLVDDNLIFIAGALCPVKDFVINNGQIILLDKYDRVKYFDLTGKLLDVKFNNCAAALNVHCNKIKFLTTLIDCNGKNIDLSKIKFKVIHADEETYFVFKDCVYIFCIEENHEYIKKWEHVIFSENDYIYLFCKNGNFICKIFKKNL